MDILSSWSGNQSRHISSLLKKWIPRIIQNVEIWHSEEDIPKGKVWFDKLREQLEQVDYGIICLTKENLNSVWIHFEAGTIQKKLEKSAIFTLLYDIKPSDIKYPLAGFQHTNLTEKKDFRRLINSINNMQEKSMEESTLDYIYDIVWDEFKKEFSSIPKIEKDAPKKNIRDEREILEEILNTVRNLDRSPITPHLIREEKMEELVNAARSLDLNPILQSISSAEKGIGSKSIVSKRILKTLSDAPKTSKEIKEEIIKKYSANYSYRYIEKELRHLMEKGLILRINEDKIKKYKLVTPSYFI